MTEANFVHLHLHRNEGPEYRDSLEIGTVRYGIIKIYGNASKPEEFELKIRNMINLRERTAAALAFQGSVAP